VLSPIWCNELACQRAKAFPGHYLRIVAVITTASCLGSKCLAVPAVRACLIAMARTVPAVPTSAPFDAAASAQLEGSLADLVIYKSLNNDIGVIIPSGSNFSRDPTFSWHGPNGSDGWKTEPSLTP
jgi:hypothetical protein